MNALKACRFDVSDNDITGKSKNNEITMLEYYKTYMNWETERWTKNVISHVGPQGLSVLMHDRGTRF